MAEQKPKNMQGQTPEEFRRYAKDKYASESILEESTMQLCRLESASRAAHLESRRPPRDMTWRIFCKQGLR